MKSIESLPSLITGCYSPTIEGRIESHHGPIYRAKLVGVSVGDYVTIENKDPDSDGSENILAKVISYDGDIVSLSPLINGGRIFSGSKVITSKEISKLTLSGHLMGSILNAVGIPLRFPQHLSPRCFTFTSEIGNLKLCPPHLLTRTPITTPLETGIRAIDGILTIGKGQRLGVFAEPGVGKSTLIATIANNSNVDINVIGLIGERGREVIELYEGGLNNKTKENTIIVASTSDEPAVSRVTAAYTATRVAEYFRDQGMDVLLQIDSLTRLFRAYREIGLASGETPVRRGYPPSVFAQIPNLIERAGKTEKGSITAFYTILLSSDLDEDPMVEELKGLTDGHILLRRSFAEIGHYPAIDVVRSLSRLSSSLQSQKHLHLARRILQMISNLDQAEDLLKFGAELNPEVKEALTHKEQIKAFLQQNKNEFSSWNQTLKDLEIV